MLLPQGNKTPPTTIASTAVLSWLLHGRPWLGELSLLVTMGPRAVAEYEFLCRTNFCIGNTTYTFDYTANENSRAAYESLVFGNRAAQTERVMNALFTEDSMRLFHRVMLEMALADNFLSRQNRGGQPMREIIVVDDNDEEMGEVGGATGIANGVVGSVADGCAPPILWDVGIDVGTLSGQPIQQPVVPALVDADMSFWDGIANECLGEGEIRTNVAGDERVGVVAGQTNVSAEMVAKFL
ncbi:hypothetical protein Bca101_082255 [Brassica carinata]